MIKLNLIKVMVVKKSKGRQVTKKSATDQGSATANGEKEQTENGGTSDKEATEAEKAASQEKVSQDISISAADNDKDVEIEKLKAQLKKVEKTDKVIDVKVTTETGKKPKLPSIRRPNNLHEVYVKGRSRLMTKQSYEAIAKDPKLDVSIPKGSTLVEPNIQPCVDC